MGSAASSAVPSSIDAAAVFDSLWKKSSSAARTIDALPIPMWALSTYTALPIISALGVTLCPNPARIAQGLAGSLGCLLGTAAGSFFYKAKKDAARCSVLRVLADHMGETTGGSELKGLIQSVRRRFGVAAATRAGEVFEESALGEVYGHFLSALLDGPENDPSDLPMLRRLRAALDLDNIVVGNAHRRAAQLLVSRGYSGLEGEDMRRAVDKLLFLTERAFSDEEPQEAGIYEMGRVRGALNVSAKEAQQRISAVSKALYRQNLSSVVDQVDAQTANSLAGASTAFGLGGDETARMNAETYRQIASDLLAGGRLSEEGKQTLQRAKGVLQLSDVAAGAAFAAVAAPFLRKEVEKAAEECGEEKAPADKIKQVAESLAAKRNDVGLPTDDGKTMIVEGFLSSLRSLYDKACKDARINGDAVALATIEQMIRLAMYADRVVDEVGPKDAEAPPLTLAADSTAGRRLYGLYLARSFSDKAAAPPEVLAVMLELSDADEETARVEVCQPRLRELYADTISKAEGGGPPLSLAKVAVNAELAKFRLPGAAVEEAALEVYKARLAPVSGRILKAPEKEDLDSARKFLDLSESDVRIFHLRAFAKVYEDAVQEGMGRRGLMTEPAREALEQLRVRLGLTEDDAEKVFYGVVEERMKGMMEGVREAWEKSTYTKEALAQIWKERGRDAGDDPTADGSGELGIQDSPKLEGIRGYELMVELTNLADFYIKNKVNREGKHVTHEEAYPVTVGKYIEDKTKEEMFGIFAWNAVTTQDTTARDLWANAKPHVGGILGMDPDKQQKVMVRMVSRWANMYIKQNIAEKGELGKNEIETLTNWVPTFFGIDQEVTKDMVQSANKGMLQSKVLRLLNQPQVSAADVHKLREDVEAWDLNIQKDLELTKPQLRSLFRVEVLASLEDTSLTEEQKYDAVASSQDSFGLNEKDAREELADLVKARARGYLVNAVGDLMQGNEPEAVNEMQRLELIAGFAEHVKGLELKKQDWEVAMPMRQRLLKTYAASPLGDGKAPNVKLLEDALGVK